ncbi:uncharacterized protein CLUP02_07787 [Colletotrichum lupini]|uniref:Uncharacterized protein n=1 Tax=Colletotrichum lupini TaxID=145971 RepID=A0A9Q8SSK1_9PEZI|nr:uncharacterized protein CLUP02_07787 [Colletotrichum lupini]UQC82300.1 hypothetical protein CLUP02_07787 [Colletotrichum lupini]
MYSASKSEEEADERHTAIKLAIIKHAHPRDVPDAKPGRNQPSALHEMKKSIGPVRPAASRASRASLVPVDSDMLWWTCGDARLYQSAARDLTMMHM